MGDFESIVSTLILLFWHNSVEYNFKSEKAADSEHEQVNMRYYGGRGEVLSGKPNALCFVEPFPTINDVRSCSL